MNWDEAQSQGTASSFRPPEAVWRNSLKQGWLPYAIDGFVEIAQAPRSGTVVDSLARSCEEAPTLRA